MTEETIRVRWVRVDGRRVRLWTVGPEQGERLPLLLIHGLGCSVEAWGPCLRVLARRAPERFAVAADLPGYGRSESPPETLGIRELADWTARLLETLSLPRAHVAGNSMGCQVALALARHYPGRVGGLALAGATDGADVVPPWRTALGLVADGFREPMLYNGTLLRMYFQMGVPRYFATARKMLDDDPIACAGAVLAPGLVVRGERDAIVPERAARALAEALPQGEFVSVPGSAHAVQFNAPDAFVNAALPFWERVERRGGAFPEPGSAPVEHR